jgi:hypothetical protein
LASIACDSRRSISIDGYAAACHETVCARAMACGTIANRSDCDLPNVAECEIDPRYIDAVHDGRIAWDGEAAAACLDESLDAGCDRTSEDYRGRTCDFSRGLLDDGEACTLSSECISNECFNELCTEACCAGACTGAIAPTPSKLGEQCRTTYCIEGFCDGSYCVPFVDEGGACEYLGQCAYGLGCSNRACHVLPDTGEPCQPTFGIDECRHIGDRCSSLTYRCQNQNFSGTPCARDDDCATLHRCTNQQCTFTRVELGELCNFDHDCATPGAVCSFIDGCILPRAAGEPCGHYSECESNICHYDTGICGTLEGCL